MFKEDASILVCVALIWGTTNSLIKKSSKLNSATKLSNNNKGSKFEIYYWLGNPLYILSVAANLLGSLLFFYKLTNSSTCFINYIANFIFLEISIAGPLVNCLTLVITTASGILINKDKFTFKSAIGILLVLIGIGFAVF